MSVLVGIRGDDEIYDIEFKMPDGVSPLNLTGAQSIKFTAKRSSLDEQAMIQKALGAGITVVSAVAGTATIAIDAIDTWWIEPTTLAWDCEIVDSAGKTRTAATGSLQLLGDVTRPSDLVPPPGSPLSIYALVAHDHSFVSIAKWGVD